MPSAKQRRWLVFLGVVALLAGAWAAYERQAGPARWQAAAEAALAEGQPEQALALCQRILQRQPQSFAALRAATEALSQVGRTEEALERLQAAEAAAPKAERPTLLRLAADLNGRAGRLLPAQAALAELVRLKAATVADLEKLIDLQQVQGSRWTARPYVLQLLRLDVVDPVALSCTGNPEGLVDVTATAEHFLRGDPECKLPLAGLARVAILREDYATARRLLREVRAAHPEHVEAFVRLLWLAAIEADGQLLRECLSQRPADCEEHPRYWVALGIAAEQAGRKESAARCFAAALQRDPCDRYAIGQLPHLLRQLGRAEEAAPLEARAELVRQVVNAVTRLADQPDDPRLVWQAATALEALGRPWEATAWYARFMELKAGDAAANERMAALREELTSTTGLQLADATTLVDCSSYPLPDLTLPDLFAGALPPDRQSDLRFEDLTEAAGLSFTYDPAYDPATPGERMQETLGGGVAVCDFDGDGWPDLYFAQACAWPPNPAQRTRLDRLYRNEFGQRVQDVTEAAGLVEAGFSQGVCAGDVNSDGWPDLYVANIGPNALFLNQGDGTFLSAPVPEKLHPLLWTASCLLGDLNGDGLPELYDVNYVAGPDAYDRICEGHACSPLQFFPEHDRLLLNLGDGGFRDVTQESGLPELDGYGLGAVAWPNDDSGRLDLFVANDQDDNLYLVQQERTRGGAIRWLNQAGPSGLGFDADGRPQACMGIAVDDATGDGLLDLFVTNFYHESNTLYVQLAPHLFQDGTRTAGLRGPSYDRVGFGAQFLDADLDAWPDLVYVNGHIGDMTDLGQPQRMRPQFLYNRGQGRFTEIAEPELGEFFQRGELGRALARLDFDADGRDDFVVSHLDTPARLVRNASPGGHALRLHLRGTASERFGYGCVVTFQAGERTITRVTHAGGGYMASNEPHWVWGLGAAAEARGLTIVWPSGVRQAFESLAADSRWLIVEGRAEPVLLPGQ